ncbi:MAG: response regulator [Acidobacteria bacterium]|nr:response regulator [Acidobacteriota bacterium]
MILAVLDDLLFTSKIRNAAARLGASIKFARSSADALAEMRQTPPALVIFDLNSARAEPLATLAAMKKDPALATVPTLGFASHLQTEVFEAARGAGMDSVLARSAFVLQLGDILRNV